MAVLTYLLYGDNKTYELEFLLSALSARIHLRSDQRGDDGSDAVRIELISDRPRFDKSFPFDVRVIDPDTMRAWTSTPGRSYNHRVKVLALLDAMRHAGDEPVALVDTDTFFTASPRRLFERIGPDATVMHEQEVPAIADDPDCADVVEFIRHGVEIEGFHMSAATPMFNSGVVGVLPSHAPLVKQALALLDALYDRAPVFNVEQFAFGVVLDQRTKLATCKDVVHHYWGHTRGFIHVQADRHVNPRDAATFCALESQPLPLLGEPPKAWQDKLASRVRGTLGGWSKDYRFAYLAACSAHRQAPHDRAIANAWAAVALEDLRRLTGEASPQRMRADFGRWFAQPLERLPWIDRELHARWHLMLQGDFSRP